MVDRNNKEEEEKPQNNNPEAGEIANRPKPERKVITVRKVQLKVRGIVGEEDSRQQLMQILQQYDEILEIIK